MTAPTITPLPTPPNRSTDSAAVFAQRADDFLGALPDFQQEANAQAAYLDDLVENVGFKGSSTSSVAIGSGSKSFTVDTGLAYQVGTYVLLASAANAANYMAGPVTAYNPTTGALTVNVNATGGSGTFADWNVTLSGPVGPLPTRATVSQLFAGTAESLYVDPKTFRDAFAYQDQGNVSGTVTLDFNTGFNFRLRLTGNITLAVPTNMKDGFSAGLIDFIQDGTGSRTLSLNSAILTPGDTAPVLSTAANAIDRAPYVVRNGVLYLSLPERAFG